MGTITETPVWEDGVRHFEANAVLTGGPDCPDNLPLSDLANRTAWLKQQVESAQNSLAGHEAAADPHSQYLTSDEGDAKVAAHVAAPDPHPAYWNNVRGDAKIAAAIAALVNSSPATLDTLAELATALGNDPNFATTITNSLATKATQAGVQGQTYTAFTTAGAIGAFTLTPIPAITAYTAGQRFRVKFHAAGSGADKLNVCALGDKNLKQYDSDGNKVAPVIAAGQLVDVEYDGADMVLLDPLPQSFDRAYRKNLVVDGACRMSQTASKSLTTSAQYGAVDMFAAWGKGTAVSAGSINQNSGAPIGTEGCSLHLSGVTITGAGVVYARHRIESAVAKALKNKTASFSVLVYHDVGAAVNYTAVIRKANAADNFSGVTVIGTSAAQAIQTATGTLLKFEGIAMGDCSNGIEIEVQAACGAIATKNFHFTEWQLEEGAIASKFDRPSVPDNIIAVERYLEKTYDLTTNPGTVTQIGAFIFDASSISDGTCPFRVRKRAIPTMTFYSANSGASGTIYYQNTMVSTTPSGDIAVQATRIGTNSVSVECSPGDGYMPLVHFVADCRL